MTLSAFSNLIFETMTLVTALLNIVVQWTNPDLDMTSTMLLYSATLLNLALNSYYSGTRLTMYPLLICFCLYSIALLFDYGLGFTFILYTLAVIASTFLSIIVGRELYSDFKPSGTHQVGCRQVLTSHGSRVLVYYPAKPETGKSFSDFPWMMDGQGDLKGIYKLFLEIAPMGLFQFASKLKQGILRDAEIAELNAYIPVVLSHGMGGSRSSMSCLSKELASNGLIVYAIGHGDLTALYCQKEEMRKGRLLTIGRAFNHVNLDNFNEFAARLGIRQKELDCLISELGVIGSKELGIHNLALEHLTLMGHSLGGASSIQMASKDSRIKYIFTIDPFLQPLQQQLEDLKTLQPHLCVVNEFYGDSNPHFDGWMAVTGLFTNKTMDKHCQKQSVLAVSQGTSHLAQTDFPFLFPFELKLSTMTSTWAQMFNPDKNIVLTWRLFKAFLAKNGAINAAFQTEIQEIEEKYEVKFEHK